MQKNVLLLLGNSYKNKSMTFAKIVEKIVLGTYEKKKKKYSMELEFIYLSIC